MRCVILVALLFSLASAGAKCESSGASADRINKLIRHYQESCQALLDQLRREGHTRWPDRATFSAATGIGDVEYIGEGVDLSTFPAVPVAINRSAAASANVVIYSNGRVEYEVK